MNFKGYREFDRLFDRVQDHFASQNRVLLEDATIAEIGQRKQERVIELKMRIDRMKKVLCDSEKELAEWESL